MYHYSNQQMYQHNPYQPCSMNIQGSKLQNLNNISEAHYHHILPQNIESNAHLQVENAIEQPPPHPEVAENVKKKKTAPKKPKSRTAKGDESKATKKPAAVDTSTFSIEERLVAAAWVHERKHTSSTISEIKHNFRKRFSRDPPSKTTLFAWERKLFSTGNVCDAPRTGRPVHRKSHISAVAASVVASPALSLRARARALRLPRSTLHHILTHDLPRPAPPHQPADKQLPKRRVKQPPRKKPPPPPPAPPPAAASAPAPPHVQYVMHAMHTQSQAHSHGYT